jgi:hypothetical protein
MLNLMQILSFAPWQEVRSGSIVLKKSKMPRQQNSRKSELIADFGWQCALRAFGKATE